MTRTTLVDLSHTIRPGMITYPGLPAPELSEHVTRADSAARLGTGVSFTIGRICMVTNVGTYIDVPFHFYAQGDQLADVAIERLADLPAVIVDATIHVATERAITAALFDGIDVGGRAVLVRTGWARHFATDAYGIDAPFLAPDAVDLLVQRGAALAGIDSVNIDDLDDHHRPAHVGLLGAGIPIVEHLTGLHQLHGLTPGSFTFSALPPKFERLGTFPVRAFARVPG